MLVKPVTRLSLDLWLKALGFVTFWCIAYILMHLKGTHLQLHSWRCMHSVKMDTRNRIYQNLYSTSDLDFSWSLCYINIIYRHQCTHETMLSKFGNDALHSFLTHVINFYLFTIFLPNAARDLNIRLSWGWIILLALPHNKHLEVSKVYYYSISILFL